MREIWGRGGKGSSYSMSIKQHIQTEGARPFPLHLSMPVYLGHLEPLPYIAYHDKVISMGFRER